MPEEEEPFDSALPLSPRRSSPAAVTAPELLPAASRSGCSPVVSPHRDCLPAYHSMADLRVGDEGLRRQRTLSNIATELIQTEQDYVNALNFVIENYVPEMLREDVPQALRGKRNIVFGNLEKIQLFHRSVFLGQLQACRKAPLRVCYCFTQHASQFYLYSLYNKNKPKSDALMYDFGAAFFRRKQMALHDRMDLSSYLLRPVQRLGKYALLLKELLKECRPDEPEFAELRAAHKMVRFQLQHGNDLLAMDALRDFDVNLQEQGRLLRQAEFLVWQGKKRCWRQIFLFEDLVLFSKTRQTQAGHDLYLYKSSFKTSDLGLTENVGNIGTRFEIWFRKRTTNETYTLQAPDVKTKVAWTREISGLLWRQAIKNRENRLAEMSRMGIGNKANIDLKPSANNIHDRFVSLSSRSTPRARNSIAVASFQHVSSPRPSSLISLGGSSSSGSSGGGGGGGGSAANSRMMSSTESGIVVDATSPLDRLLESPAPCSPDECFIENPFEPGDRVEAPVRAAEWQPPAEVPVRAAEWQPPAEVPVRAAERQPPAEVPVRAAEWQPPAEVPMRAAEWQPPAEAPVRAAERQPPAEAPVRTAERQPPAETPVRTAERQPPAETPVRTAERQPPAETPVRTAERQPPAEALSTFGKSKLVDGSAVAAAGDANNVSVDSAVAAAGDANNVSVDSAVATAGDANNVSVDSAAAAAGDANNVSVDSADVGLGGLSKRLTVLVQTVTTDITAATLEDACTQTTLKRGTTRVSLAANQGAPSGVKTTSITGVETAPTGV